MIKRKILYSQKGNVDEEVLGHVRSAAGKARLLATKKFKQFEGMHSVLFIFGSANDRQRNLSSYSNNDHKYSVLFHPIGLCDDSINQTKRDMPPPTPADLQGFWEMVYLQVENIDSLFVELEQLRANGWKVWKKNHHSRHIRIDQIFKRFSLSLSHSVFSLIQIETDTGAAETTARCEIDKTTDGTSIKR